MKNHIKLPTILGLLVLTFGLMAGIFLIKKNQDFQLGANVAATPQNVRLSNITDVSLTVTWTTEVPSQGFVKWGTSNNSFSEVALEENNNEKQLVHSVNLTGITNSANVFIKINSEGQDYDNNGIPWQTTTLASGFLPRSPNLTSGTILQVDGVTPAKALVYLTINGKLLSNLTSDEGTFVVPVSSYIENLTDNTIIEISVQDGNGITSQAVIYPRAARSVPTMVMGKTYDFRTITANDNETQPESSLSIPESVEVSSRFEVTRSEPTQTGEVTLESHDNGEIITTTDPEFFGSAPENTQIEISVESELQTDTVVADTTGQWDWSPPNNLEPGEHKVTIKWKDANGILRTLTRSFVVSAADGPAFESSSSGNLITPSPRPTQTPIATVAPVQTLIPSATAFATQMPTPETGSLTATLGLFIMGMGVLLSSIFVYKKSNA